MLCVDMMWNLRVSSDRTKPICRYEADIRQNESYKPTRSNLTRVQNIIVQTTAVLICYMTSLIEGAMVLYPMLYIKSAS